MPQISSGYCCGPVSYTHLKRHTEIMGVNKGFVYNRIELALSLIHICRALVHRLVYVIIVVGRKDHRIQWKSRFINVIQKTANTRLTGHFVVALAA